jgi:hypothetical protein
MKRCLGSVGLRNKISPYAKQLNFYWVFDNYKDILQITDNNICGSQLILPRCHFLRLHDTRWRDNCDRYVRTDSEASGRDCATVQYQDVRAGTEDIHKILSQASQCHFRDLNLVLSGNECRELPTCRHAQNSVSEGKQHPQGSSGCSCLKSGFWTENRRISFFSTFGGAGSQRANASYRMANSHFTIRGHHKTAALKHLYMRFWFILFRLRKPFFFPLALQPKFGPWPTSMKLSVSLRFTRS